MNQIYKFIWIVQVTGNVVDLDSNDSNSGSRCSDGGYEADDDTDADEFIRDIIVSPPMNSVKPQVDGDVLSSIKRNLTKDFDESSKTKAPVLLKKVKIERE
jgi:hypothetical protein